MPITNLCLKLPGDRLTPNINQLVRSGMSGQQPLIEVAHCLLSRYPEQLLQDSTQQMRDILGRFGSVQGRKKSNTSGLNKLVRRQHTWQGHYKDTPTNLAKIYGDTIGVRLVMEPHVPMDTVIEALAEEVEKGELQILIAQNYVGKGGVQYLGRKHFKILRDATKAAGFHPFAQHSTSKASGYVCGQFNVVFKNGAIGEFQIRGSQVDAVARAENLIYNRAKAFSETLPDDLQGRLDALHHALDQLSRRESALHKRYVAAHFKRARILEQGGYMKEVDFPQALAQYPALDFTQIGNLNTDIEKFLAQRQARHPAPLDRVG